jgi:GNAT superfamily N-acetyltransferase
MMRIVKFEQKYLDTMIELFSNEFEKFNMSFNGVFPDSENLSKKIKEKIISLSEKNPLFLCLEGERLIGYMGGFIFSNERHGKALYIPEWANCVLDLNSEDIFVNLYSELSSDLLKEGVRKHIISVLVSKRKLYYTMNLLGFGYFVIDVVRDLRNYKIEKNDFINIREASSNDLKVLYNFEFKLYKYLSGSPIFLPFLKTLDIDEMRKQIEEKSFPTFILSENGKDFAYMKTSGENSGSCFVARDEKTFSITRAFCEREYRRSGLGKKLLNKVFSWGYENGFSRCETDFESANSSGRSFWMNNFTPFCYSFCRTLDRGMFIK